MTATARPKTGWLLHFIDRRGFVHQMEALSLKDARELGQDAICNYGSIAACVDNIDGIHNDNSYGDIDVLRWAGLR